ncbi:MAG: HEPN domain-containing protein [Candidatus Caldarchaeum sp.]|nr:HEPN domain-containing protein [Candidatus Caldarchaeum sp.]
MADWMKQAKADLKAARDLFSTGNFGWSCFACHQAAEKALKAVLENFGHPKTGHDPVELVNEVNRFVASPQEVREGCRNLNRHYITPR